MASKHTATTDFEQRDKSLNLKKQAHTMRAAC
jgi:hypothetical protein